MTAAITRTVARAASPLAAVDLARVQVELAGSGKRVKLGTAAAALRDRRLTASERAAVTALVRAVELLRTRARLAGIDDAGQAVRLILRDSDASANGPWATRGAVAVGARNALGARTGARANPNVLLTVDAAVHELAHVVQFGRMNASATPHAALLEGIADSVALLATGDDTLGEEFFRRDAKGRHRGAIRVLGSNDVSGAPLGDVIRHYSQVEAHKDEPHTAGGIVSAAFLSIRSALGRERAEQLLWSVIRDDAAWRTGGSWKAFTAALVRAGERLWSDDATARDAIRAALRTTGLDVLLD